MGGGGGDEDAEMDKRRRTGSGTIRGTVNVGPIGKKVQESKLKWFGHVEQRSEEYAGNCRTLSGAHNGWGGRREDGQTQKER